MRHTPYNTLTRGNKVFTRGLNLASWILCAFPQMNCRLVERRYSPRTVARKIKNGQKTKSKTPTIGDCDLQVHPSLGPLLNFVSIFFSFLFSPSLAICVRCLVASFQAFGCPTSYPRWPRGPSERIGSCFKRCRFFESIGR